MCCSVTVRNHNIADFDQCLSRTQRTHCSHTATHQLRCVAVCCNTPQLVCCSVTVRNHDIADFCSHHHNLSCTFMKDTIMDGYCSTVQGLLDWFEVDFGFTELSFIQIDLCVLCDFVLHSRVSLSSCPFLDILHCLPRSAEASVNRSKVTPQCRRRAAYTHTYT